MNRDDWATGSQVAGIPGMPNSTRVVSIWGETGRITRRARQFGKGWEYLVASLPPEAQAHLRAQAAAPVAPAAPVNESSSPAPMTSRRPVLSVVRQDGGLFSSATGALGAGGTLPDTLDMAPKGAAQTEPEPVPGGDARQDAPPALRQVKATRALTATRMPRSTASADLWQWAEVQTQDRRDQGAARALLVQQVVDLIAAGSKRDEALAAVARAHTCSAGTLRTWYVQARRHDACDWAAVLIPNVRGRAPDSGRVDVHPAAWDWFKALWLTRSAPTVAEIYRRLVETAEQTHRAWLPLPSEDTFARRVKEISLPTRVFHRQGKDALARLIPRQRRDNTVYAPGQAVNGDGLKFDRIWVQWPDGEILNTSTGWFWQDLRTGKLVAHRLAKTENTDLFRLATYDLTGVCLPEAAWLDNTTVAANLAMTGQAQGRHRFHHERRANDPLGMLQQLGITPHFTDPDKEVASPGSKRIERAFGIGGLHQEVANNPRLCEQGWSKATAVPYDLFASVVAEEVGRFNSRAKRRAPECAGVKSYDQLWAELTAGAVPRVAAESQRRLLLLMVEKCRANAATGEVSIKAGSSHLGATRYWSDWMPEIRGRDVACYFDPQDLQRPLTIYSLAGLRLGEAARLADAGHNDTDAAREVRKARRRAQKAMKLMAQDDVRISALVAAEQYPAAAATPSVPAPGIVRGMFGAGRRVDVDTGEIIDLVPAGAAAGAAAGPEEQERVFAAAVATLAQARERVAI